MEPKGDGKWLSLTMETVSKMLSPPEVPLEESFVRDLFAEDSSIGGVLTNE